MRASNIILLLNICAGSAFALLYQFSSSGSDWQSVAISVTIVFIWTAVGIIWSIQREVLERIAARVNLWIQETSNADKASKKSLRAARVYLEELIGLSPQHPHELYKGLNIVSLFLRYESYEEIFENELLGIIRDERIREVSEFVAISSYGEPGEWARFRWISYLTLLTGWLITKRPQGKERFGRRYFVYKREIIDKWRDELLQLGTGLAPFLEKVEGWDLSDVLSDESGETLKSSLDALYVAVNTPKNGKRPGKFRPEHLLDIIYIKTQLPGDPGFEEHYFWRNPKSKGEMRKLSPDHNLAASSVIEKYEKSLNGKQAVLPEASFYGGG